MILNQQKYIKYDGFNFENSLLKDIKKIYFGLNSPKIWTGYLNFDQKINKEQQKILENQNLEKAHKKRKLEFLASRELASYALLDFSISNFIVQKSHQGFPIWPKYINGSISHNKVSVAIILAKESWILGVDVELVMSDITSYYIKKHFFNKSEIEKILKFKKYLHNTLVTLVFSAKETLYKAFYNELFSLKSFVFISFGDHQTLIFELSENHTQKKNYIVSLL